MQSKFLSIALGSLLAFGGVSVVFAQENSAPPPQQQGAPQQGQGPGGPQRMTPDEQLQHLTRQLGLSPDQQTQIKPILVSRQEKLQALFENQLLARPDRRAKVQAVRENSVTRIEAVLNDQQKQKFEAMQQRTGERRGAGQGGTNQPGVNPPPDPTGPPLPVSDLAPKAQPQV